jgi:ADP-heptose:LPS heptosyltransferase
VLPTPRPARSPIGKVLVIRPDHVGDVLLSSPAVSLLRQSLSNARMSYLVGPWSAEAARCGPHVDEVRTLAFPAFRRVKSNLLEPYAVLAREARRLKSEQYDLAVVLRPDDWWSALLALSAGIPMRVGGRTDETAPLLTHARTAPADEHWVEQALGIARVALQAVGAAEAAVEPHLIFHVSAEARAQAEAWWRTRGLDDNVTAIHPNAGAVLKSWPLARWTDLVDAVRGKVLLSGAPGDDVQLRMIAERATRKPVLACGQSLQVTAAVFERCKVVIGPDSGALHLAGAVGTPTLRLFGPASPTVFGPWPPMPRQQVLLTQRLTCVPCGHMVDPPCGARVEPACMLALGIEDVLARIEN